jgi:hypothetical protein
MGWIGDFPLELISSPQIFAASPWILEPKYA